MKLVGLMLVVAAVAQAAIPDQGTIPNLTSSKVFLRASYEDGKRNEAIQSCAADGLADIPDIPLVSSEEQADYKVDITISEPFAIGGKRERVATIILSEPPQFGLTMTLAGLVGDKSYDLLNQYLSAFSLPLRHYFAMSSSAEGMCAEVRALLGSRVLPAIRRIRPKVFIE